MTERPSALVDRPFPPRIAREAVGALSRPLATVARTVAFWIAVALPLLYPPLLVGGLSGSELVTFVGLLACNGLALLVGHGYGSDA